MLQIAPGDSLLRSKELPRELDDVSRLRELENRESVGDGSESGEQGLTAQNRIKNREHQGRNGAAELGQKPKDIVRTAGLAQQGNPRRTFGVLKTVNMETLERMESKSDNAVTK